MKLGHKNITYLYVWTGYSHAYALAQSFSSSKLYFKLSRGKFILKISRKYFIFDTSYKFLEKNK